MAATPLDFGGAPHKMLQRPMVFEVAVGQSGLLRKMTGLSSGSCGRWRGLLDNDSDEACCGGVRSSEMFVEESSGTRWMSRRW